MVSKVFTPGTVVDSAWLNDVNNAVYNASSAEALNSIVAKYGAVGDGVTNDTAAFSAAEASSDIRIFLPAGIYVYNGVPALTKYYYGDGQIKVNGTLVGQTYSNITVATPLLSSPAAYGEGDINHVNVEKVRLNGNRVGIDQYYFEARTTPHFVQFYTSAGAGHSGSSAKLTADCLVGATTCTVNNVGTEIQIGREITIGDGAGQFTNRATVTNIVGNTITFTPAATTNALAVNFQYVSIASRTMNPYEYIEVEHSCGGDAYAIVSRVIVGNNDQQPGQTHFFRTATGGIIGGDMIGTRDGVYLTGCEIQYIDTSFSGTKNIAVIDQVTNFQRSSDTGSFGCVWIGNLQQSYGTQYVDAAFSLLGKFKTGLNTVLADLGVNGAAVSMGAGQKIYFDSVSTSAQGDAQLYGNVTGGTSIGINTGAGAMEHKVNNVSVALYNSTAWFFQTGVNVTFNKDIYAKQGFKLYFDGNTGSPDTYITDDGTYLKTTVNGQDKILINSGFIYLGNTGVEVQINQRLNLTGQAPTTTVGAAGPAPAPPAPVAYLPIKIDGTTYKIPFYNV